MEAQAHAELAGAGADAGKPLLDVAGEDRLGIEGCRDGMGVARQHVAGDPQQSLQGRPGADPCDLALQSREVVQHDLAELLLPRGRLEPRQVGHRHARQVHGERRGLGRLLGGVGAGRLRGNELAAEAEARFVTHGPSTRGGSVETHRRHAKSPGKTGSGRRRGGAARVGSDRGAPQSVCRTGSLGLRSSLSLPALRAAALILSGSRALCTNSRPRLVNSRA